MPLRRRIINQRRDLRERGRLIWLYMWLADAYCKRADGLREATETGKDPPP